MTNIIDAPDVTSDDYCVLGLATCFVKQDGEIHQLQIVEPIPSAALEALFKGIPTSYQLACALSIGEIISNNIPVIPAEFPADSRLCEDFVYRLVAASRTYKRKEEAKSLIPLGTVKRDFNFSTEKKRILNAVNVVRAEDNVKQHSHTNNVF